MSDKADTVLFRSAEWTPDLLDRTYLAIEDIAFNDLGLDVYPNQIEIVSAEQMLNAYASIGMPLMYWHWSFGKHFARNEQMYRKGMMGLAYEIVINSNPCISYNMEENTMTMMALVMAHAAFGHNHFYKNNYLMRMWTDAEGILDYLEFAKKYVIRCEEKHGYERVKRVLNYAHALMTHGVFRYERKFSHVDFRRELLEREAKRREHRIKQYDPIMEHTLPASATPQEISEEEERIKRRKEELKLPEENILYFLEQHSPVLEEWEREILRIVRNIAQYFYPQRQTKVMNEGFASFVHHYIMNALYDKGLLTEGAMIEFNHSHSNVLFQPDFDNPRYQGLNPYKLGFTMFQGIQRICTGVDPHDGKPCTEEQLREDREWFPQIAGYGDWRGVIKYAVANYRDESFIMQFLSPLDIRRLKLFELENRNSESHMKVTEISDEKGYRRMRNQLADQYSVSLLDPDIQIVDIDLLGDRHLKLEHVVRDGVFLEKEEDLRDMTLAYIKELLGFDVTLVSIDYETGNELCPPASTVEDEEDA